MGRRLDLQCQSISTFSSIVSSFCDTSIIRHEALSCKVDNVLRAVRQLQEQDAQSRELTQDLADGFAQGPRGIDDHEPRCSSGHDRFKNRPSSVRAPSTNDVDHPSATDSFSDDYSGRLSPEPPLDTPLELAGSKDPSLSRAATFSFQQSPRLCLVPQSPKTQSKPIFEFSKTSNDAVQPDSIMDNKDTTSSMVTTATQPVKVHSAKKVTIDIKTKSPTTNRSLFVTKLKTSFDVDQGTIYLGSEWQLGDASRTCFLRIMVVVDGTRATASSVKRRIEDIEYVSETSIVSMQKV